MVEHFNSEDFVPEERFVYEFQSAGKFQTRNNGFGYAQPPVLPRKTRNEQLTAKR